MDALLTGRWDTPLNHRGYCQCGWESKRRWLRSSAVLDVLDHCELTGHEPALARAAGERGAPSLLV
jgi:hypothetical protein